MTRRCDHCEFFVQNYTDPRVGTCHRFPPEVDPRSGVGHRIASFPSVHHNYWCGEFERDAEKTGGTDAP